MRSHGLDDNFIKRKSYRSNSLLNGQELVTLNVCVCSLGIALPIVVEEKQ